MKFAFRFNQPIFFNGSSIGFKLGASMKTLINFTAIVFVMAMSTVSIKAQEVPADLLEEAKMKFETAFEAEYENSPSPEVTKKAMDQYKQNMATLAASLGAAAGKEAAYKDAMALALKNGDGLKFMKNYRHSRTRSITEMAVKKTHVAEIAEPEMAVNQFEGPALAKDASLAKDLKKNTEIIFPAGSFEVDEQTINTLFRRARKGFPSGVAFVGDGKSKTTLKITDMSLTDGDVSHLSFRDMTIDCDNDGLFDKRSGALTLKLTNVRLVRFDAGHGGCTLFSINEGLIVHAQDTDFVGGFGSSPGNGSVFERCDLLLGHFERCSFTGINYDWFRAVSRNTKLWMDECRFDKPVDKAVARFRPFILGFSNVVEFSDCQFDFKPEKIDWAPKED